jgi:hypothetical protein
MCLACKRTIEFNIIVEGITFCLLNFTKYRIVDGWVMSLLPNVNFIKARIEKHLSSSTLFITCTMVNSIGFTYSWKLKNNIQDVVTRHQILVKSSQEFLYHDIFRIHFVGFAIIESYFKNVKVFGKKTSLFDYN